VGFWGWGVSGVGGGWVVGDGSGVAWGVGGWVGRVGGAGSGGVALECFWLYDEDGNEGTNAGRCKSKDDVSVVCGDAKRSEQCTLNDVMNFGTNCVWLEGSTTEGIWSECRDRVCLCGLV
jgi:hypothetical protein